MNRPSSIKKNFAWSSLLTISGYIFPILTFPYVTRVLGAEGFGYYQFAENAIHYFTILSMLGIGTVGIREIAKANGDERAMSRAYSSILTLNILISLFSIALLLVLSISIPSFKSHSRLLYIGISRLLFNALLVEWLFKGLENFSYITIRAIAVRCIYVISVFVFVRKSDDYVAYFILTSLITVVNALINIVYAKKFVVFNIKEVDFRPYIIPVLTLGLYSALTAVYTSLNSVYLGTVCGDVQVGYYSVATRTHHIILSLYTAFTGVMLPRMSALLSKNKLNEFNHLIDKSVTVLFCFALPLIFFIYIYSPEIIRILSGDDFTDSISCLRIVAPLVMVIGYEQILVIQVLMPLGKDKAILMNSIVGSLVCVIANLLFVKHFMAIGTSWVWFASEISVMLSAQYFVSKCSSIRFPIKEFLKYLICGTPAIIGLFFISCLNINRIIVLIFASVFIIWYYFIVYVYVIRVPLIKQMVDNVKKKITHV